MNLKQKMNRHIKKDDQAIIFDMLVGAGFAVIMLFAIMNIGTYINGTIGSTLVDSYGAAATRTTNENMTVNTLTNLSGKYDSTVEMVSVAAIITVITLPLAAVVAVRKLF